MAEALAKEELLKRLVARLADGKPKTTKELIRELERKYESKPINSCLYHFTSQLTWICCDEEKWMQLISDNEKPPRWQLVPLVIPSGGTIETLAATMPKKPHRYSIPLARVAQVKGAVDIYSSSAPPTFPEDAPGARRRMMILSYATRLAEPSTNMPQEEKKVAKKSRTSIDEDGEYEKEHEMTKLTNESVAPLVGLKEEKPMDKKASPPPLKTHDPAQSMCGAHTASDRKGGQLSEEKKEEKKEEKSIRGVPELDRFPPSVLAMCEAYVGDEFIFPWERIAFPVKTNLTLEGIDATSRILIAIDLGGVHDVIHRITSVHYATFPRLHVYGFADYMYNRHGPANDERVKVIKCPKPGKDYADSDLKMHVSVFLASHGWSTVKVILMSRDNAIANSFCEVLRMRGADVYFASSWPELSVVFPSFTRLSVKT